MSTRTIILIVVAVVVVVIGYFALTPQRGGESPEPAAQGEEEPTQGEGNADQSAY